MRFDDVATNICQTHFARHVIARHLTRDTNVQMRVDDVATNSWQTQSARPRRHRMPFDSRDQDKNACL